MIEKEHQLDDFLGKYRRLIINNAYMYVNDYYTAEDICQETFLRYYRNIDKIPDHKAKSWLLQVSENLAIDHLRKGGKYRTDVGLDMSLLEIADESHPDPVTIVVSKEVHEMRKRVLARLKREKPIWYEIIMLSDVEGKSNEEIADIYAVQPSLVSKWKERGKRWLRDRYELEEERLARKRQKPTY